MDGNEISNLKSHETPMEITPEMLKNPSIRIGRREIPLAYNLRAQIAFEEEIGMTWDELRENINQLKGNKNTKTAVKVIRILGNQGLRLDGMDPDLTDDWLLDHIAMKNMLAYKVAILQALFAGRYMESEGSEEDEVDIGLIEIRKKNESIS